MKTAFLKFARDERGATAIEYGIIAGLVAVVLIGAFGPGGTSVATRLTAAFANISTHLATIL